jgi:outer membrane receptor for ferrienterochelin and colicins
VTRRHGNTLRITSTCLLTSLVSVSPCLANQIDLFELSLTELMNTQVQVAAKRDTPINQTPSSISVFSGQQLADMGVTNLVGLLDIIPGFYAMYNPVEGNQSYIATRGHSQKYASNILFLVNGQRLNDDYTGGINYFNRFLPLTFVDRVEVIRGPGSALYGSNAFNGVINILTKPDAQISLNANSFDGRGGSVGITQKLKEAEISLGIQYQEDKGETIAVEFDRFNLQSKTQDPRQQFHFDAQVRLKNIEWQTLWYESNRQDYYLFRRLRDGVTDIKMSQFSTGLTWQVEPSENILVNSYVQYQNSHRESLTALAVKDPTTLPDADFLFGEDIDYQSTRLGVDIHTKLNDTQQWDNGFEWVSSQVPNGHLRSNYNIFGNEEYLGEVVTFNNANQRVVQDKTRKITSAYTQIESKWHAQFSSMIGARFDHYNDTGSKWSPRISLIHNASASTTWKLIYSEAYRAPSLGDLYDEESGLTVGSEELNASTLRSTEINYNYLDDQHHLNIILFNNDIHDLIGFRTVGNDTFLDNISNSHSQGVEWEWTWVLSQNIKLINQATHILNISSNTDQTELIANEKLSPNHFGLSQLHWKINDKLNSYIGMHWRSSVDVLQDDSHLKIWDVKLNYAMPLSQRVSFTVQNALDKTYSTGSAVALGTLDNNTVYQEYPARGREWSLEYNWRW